MAGNKIKTAFILAAGFGKRLRPLTNDLPKPLVALDGKPLMDHIIDKLIDVNIQRVIVNGHYLSDKLRQHIEALNKIYEDIDFVFSHEDEVLETGGGLKHAEALLPDSHDELFYIINGDSFWLSAMNESLLRAMHDQYNPNAMQALLALCPKHETNGYEGDGDFIMDASGRLKRRPDGATSNYVYMGAQITTKRILNNAPDGPHSLNILWDHIIAEEALYGHVFQGQWFHISTPKDHQFTESYLERNSSNQRYYG